MTIIFDPPIAAAVTLASLLALGVTMCHAAGLVRFTEGMPDKTLNDWSARQSSWVWAERRVAPLIQLISKTFKRVLVGAFKLVDQTFASALDPEYGIDVCGIAYHPEFLPCAVTLGEPLAYGIVDGLARYQPIALAAFLGHGMTPPEQSEITALLTAWESSADWKHRFVPILEDRVAVAKRSANHV